MLFYDNPSDPADAWPPLPVAIIDCSPLWLKTWLIAGLVAEGTTEIENIELIDRGYEDVVQKLSGLGAQIKRVPITTPLEQKKAL